MKNQYSGIIFDLDGTLLDTVGDLHDTLNTILSQEGFPQVTIEQTRDYIGNGLFRLIQRAIPDERKGDDDYINSLLARFVEEYRKRLVNKTKPFPGVAEMLKNCLQKGIPLGVASNKSDEESREIMDKLLPETEFAGVIGHRKGFPHKPDPGIIYELLEKMKREPEEVLYVGDSKTDFETAANAGLDCILVTYGYEKASVMENLPVEKFDSVEDLREYIELIVK